MKLPRRKPVRYGNRPLRVPEGGDGNGRYLCGITPTRV